MARAVLPKLLAPPAPVPGRLSRLWDRPGAGGSSRAESVVPLLAAGAAVYGSLVLAVEPERRVDGADSRVQKCGVGDH